MFGYSLVSVRLLETRDNAVTKWKHSALNFARS